MKRWFWKRWVWTGVFGVTAAVGLAVAAGGGKDASAPASPHKVGDVVTLKFQNGPEKKVKILKSEKQPDGSYLQEVKDMKSGEVFSLVDKSHLGPDSGKKTTPAKTATPVTSASAAKSKAQPANTPVPAPIKDAKASKPTTSMTASKPTVAAPAPLPPEPPEEKPGFLKRLFGKKPTPPTAPAMPVTSPVTMPPSSGMPMTSAKPSFGGSATTSAKPTAKPALTPPSSVFEPGPGAYPNPTTTTSRPSAGTATIGSPKLIPEKLNSTSEPPRVSTTSTPPKQPPGPPLTPPQPVATKPQPAPKPPVKPFAAPPSAADSELSRTIPANPTARPAEPPKPQPMNSVKPPSVAFPDVVPPATRPPVVTPPLPIPTTPAPLPTPTPAVPAPTTATPAPLPIPSVPSAPVPVVPAVPTPTPLPSIPVPPGGMSAGRSPVMQAGYTSVAAMALVQDIQPHVVTLRTAVAPSMRVLAARALSGGRHASTDTVKSILFIACTSDPSPFVRASCIDELCKLGYFDPAFMAHLHKATGDSADEVRTAAKEALEKMTPRK